MSVEVTDRSYVVLGETFKRVTSVIDLAPKPWLGRWAAKAVAEAVVETWAALHPLLSSGNARQQQMAVSMMKGAPWTGTAAELGRRVHAWVEDHVKGVRRGPDLDEDLLPYVEAFEHFIMDWKPTWVASERLVLHRELGYAGTIDVIAELPDLGRVLLDVKTGKSVYAEYALQLAAYDRATSEITPWGEERAFQGPGKALVVHLHHDGTYSLHPVDIGDAVFEAFKALLALSEWSEVTSKRVVKSPIRPSTGRANSAEETELEIVIP